MSKKITLEPINEQEKLSNKPEELKEAEFKENISLILIPESLTKQESEYILNEVVNLGTIYISASQLGGTAFPKDPKWYINEIMLLLKEFNVITIK